MMSPYPRDAALRVSAECVGRTTPRDEAAVIASTEIDSVASSASARALAAIDAPKTVSVDARLLCTGGYRVGMGANQNAKTAG